MKGPKYMGKLGVKKPHWIGVISTWMSQEVSKRSAKQVKFGDITYWLTIDPNFQRDILVPPSYKLSHEKKSLLLSIESWLVNRDPYNGLI